jgi:hypothetical protein
MLDRRHFAERIDRQVAFLALFAGLDIEHMQLVRCTQLFEQRQRGG